MPRPLSRTVVAARFFPDGSIPGAKALSLEARNYIATILSPCPHADGNIEVTINVVEQTQSRIHL
jgi:hypothetical protein